jgi:parvulin-like peptidyl-prolyl isomerase
MPRALSRLFPIVLGIALATSCTGTKTEPAGGAGGAASAIAISAPPDSLVGTKLATVNGLPVGSLSFDALAQRKTPAGGSTFSAEEKASMLDEAIVDELLFQEAMRRGAFHDPKVKKILVNLLLREEVYDRVQNDDFADAQLQAFFDSHKEEFIVPEKVQIKRLFFQVSPERDQAAAEKLATDLIAKIKADPEQFTQLAMEHSNDPFARRGGDLGYLDRTGKPGVPPEVVTKAFSMNAGDVSEPFFAAGGVNVIYVPAKRERIDRTFEQMRGSVLRRMKNEKFEELSKQFVEKLRGAGKVDIDAAALGAYNPAPPARPTIPLGAPGEAPEGAPDAGGEAPPPAPGGAKPEESEGNPNAEARELMRKAEEGQ